MQPFGMKGVAALVLVCHFLLFAVLFYGNYKTFLQCSQLDAEQNTSAAVSTEEPVQGNKTSWKISQACGTPSLRILYFVHTAPTNIEKRRWIRKTLDDPIIAAQMNSAVAFFVGVAPELKDNETVVEEAWREGDIVVLNFTDTYKNLSHKFLQGAKWVADHCRLDATAVIVKLDDDVLVNLPALSAYLTSGVMALTGIHCAVLKGAAPFRTQKSKWYVSKNDYPLNVYPPYCTGAAFIMQRSVLLAIYEAATHVPFLWVDDVYITGVVAKYANVSLVDISPYMMTGKGRTMPAVKDITIFVHTGWYETASDKSEQVWQRFKEYNGTIRHNFNRNVHAYYRIVG